MESSQLEVRGQLELLSQTFSRNQRTNVNSTAHSGRRDDQESDFQSHFKSHIRENQEKVKKEEKANALKDRQSESSAVHNNAIKDDETKPLENTQTAGNSEVNENKENNESEADYKNIEARGREGKDNEDKDSVENENNVVLQARNEINHQDRTPPIFLSPVSQLKDSIIPADVTVQTLATEVETTLQAKDGALVEGISLSDELPASFILHPSITNQSMSENSTNNDLVIGLAASNIDTKAINVNLSHLENDEALLVNVKPELSQLKSLSNGIFETALNKESNKGLGGELSGGLNRGLNKALNITALSPGGVLQRGTETLQGVSPSMLLDGRTADIAMLSSDTIVDSALKQGASLGFNVQENTSQALLSLTQQTLQQAVQQAAPMQIKAPSLGGGDFAQRFADHIAWFRSQNLQVAEMRLHPRDLGSIVVRIEGSGDLASVNFVAQNAAVKDVLDQNLVKLKELFDDAGLNLVDVNVSDQSEQAKQNKNDHKTESSFNKTTNDDKDLLAADESIVNRSEIDSIYVLDFYI